MSEGIDTTGTVQRYDVPSSMVADANGQFVAYPDYEALRASHKALVEALEEVMPLANGVLDGDPSMSSGEAEHLYGARLHKARAALEQARKVMP